MEAAVNNFPLATEIILEAVVFLLDTKSPLVGICSLCFRDVKNTAWVRKSRSEIVC